MRAKPTSHQEKVFQRLLKQSRGKLIMLRACDLVIPSRCPLIPTLRLTQRAGRVSNSPTVIKVIPELGYVPKNCLVVSQRAAKVLKGWTIKDLVSVGKRIEGLIKKSERKLFDEFIEPHQ
jgi:hypothetical protein